MTMTPFTCDDFSEHLAAHLARDASTDVDAEMQSHAASCGACAALLQELAAITSAAGALPDLVPTRDLWGGIAARIEAPVVPIPSAARRRAGAVSPTAGRPWWAQPAAAAAALVAVTAGITHYMTRQAIEQPVAAPSVAEAPAVSREATVVNAVPPGQAADAALGASPPPLGASTRANAAGGTMNVSPAATWEAVRGGEPRVAAGGQREDPNWLRAGFVSRAGGELQLASYRPGEIAVLDSLYYREIVRLRQLLSQRTTSLDPATVAVIDRNMLVIDRAIQECREALAADPASKFLNQQLNEALESKIELLRTAAMMPVGS